MNKYAELTAGLDIQAEVSKVRDFLNSNPVGAVTKILVLICVSDRIAYDQPKELVELDAVIVRMLAVGRGEGGEV